jgi:hypothetical protein
MGKRLAAERKEWCPVLRSALSSASQRNVVDATIGLYVNREAGGMAQCDCFLKSVTHADLAVLSFDASCN